MQSLGSICQTESSAFSLRAVAPAAAVMATAAPALRPVWRNERRLMKPTDPSLLWSSTRRSSTIGLHPPVVHRLGEFAPLLQDDARPARAQHVDAAFDPALLDHGHDPR